MNGYYPHLNPATPFNATNGRVKITITTGITLGRMCFHEMRSDEAPSDCAACTYMFSRTATTALARTLEVVEERMRTCRRRLLAETAGTAVDDARELPETEDAP